MTWQKSKWRMLLPLLVTCHLSLITSFAAPRVLPQAEAEHFCRLLVSDGQGSVYPLSNYARHLTTVLCGQPSYGDYSAEQVFTGLVFFYDDWAAEPFMAKGDAAIRQLVCELHSGATLRVFPHKSDGGVSWYAPTDRLPGSVDAEHRRYMHEVFSRLNGEVQAENWTVVGKYVDRMLQYQCQYGSEAPRRQPTTAMILLLLLPAALLAGVYSVKQSFLRFTS